MGAGPGGNSLGWKDVYLGVDGGYNYIQESIALGI